jgi:hypothetical protein
MRKRNGKAGGLFALGVALVLAAGQASAAEPKVRTFAAGLSYDHFSRTVVWAADEPSSKILSHMASVRAEIGLANGLLFTLSAGLSLTDFQDLTFGTLPISLQYAGAPLKGLALGAELVAPFLKLGDFEISAAGRFVYSVGMSKTWPLEGFAVEGEARGKPNWMEASVGPRFAYLFFGRLVPYAEVSVRWLRADFRIAETLEDLSGEETKRVKGDIAFSVSLGADAKVTDRIAVKAKVGVMPFAGGVDSLISVGLLYRF